jgi:DNA mismatch endonuclease (patch repair protein)
MQSNKGRDTQPELALRSAAHALGLRYRVSVRPLRELRRTADLVFTKARVAVFLDGCFWHGCPDHHTVAATNAGFWAEKVESTRSRDRDTDRRLADAGWTSIRVWEHEDPMDAANRIQAVIASKNKQPRVLYR